MERIENEIDSNDIPVGKLIFIGEKDSLLNIGLNFPLVAKVEHKDVIHNSDEGGVLLYIKNE